MADAGMEAEEVVRNEADEGSGRSCNQAAPIWRPSMRQRTKARHVSGRLLSKGKGLGRKVAYWQMERSLSDDELASKAHISVELLKKIKTGEQESSASMRRKIAEALKVTVGELLE